MIKVVNGKKQLMCLAQRTFARVNGSHPLLFPLSKMLTVWNLVLNRAEINQHKTSVYSYYVAKEKGGQRHGSHSVVPLQKY